MSRRILLAGLFAIIVLASLFFRKLGWGELAVVAAVVVLAFGAESIRFVVKQYLKGYRK